MAFTLKQLAALEGAIASGELSVSYDGKSVSYRSISDLMAARDVVRSDLIANGLLAEPARSNRGPASLATFSRD